jgi:hypothetical protein
MAEMRNWSVALDTGCAIPGSWGVYMRKNLQNGLKVDELICFAVPQIMRQSTTISFDRGVSPTQISQ